MNRRSIAYSALLFIGLLIVGVMLNRGQIQGVSSEGEVSLSSTSTTYLLGETIIFTGRLDFAQNEENVIDAVRIRNTSGAQDLDVYLPVVSTGGQFVDLTGTGVKGDLSVKISFNNVGMVENGRASTMASTLGTTLVSTLGTTIGNTLAGLSGTGTFKGLAAGAHIEYVVQWTPPILLDPQPVFSLISYPAAGTRQREAVADLATIKSALPAVTSVSGTELPELTAGIEIPVVGQPTGTVIPNSTSTFSIPLVSVVTNATATDAKITGSAPTLDRWVKIPDTSSLAASAPAGTGTIDESAGTYRFTAKELPAISGASQPAGVEELDTEDENISASSTLTTIINNNNYSVSGLATDGSYFFIANDKGDFQWSWGADEIIMVNATTSQIVWTMDGPNNRDIEGLAYYNNILYVAANGMNWEDSGYDWNNAGIFKIDVTNREDWTNSSLSSGFSSSDWFGASDCTAPCSSGRAYVEDTWDQIGGVAVDGSGSKLYATHKWGHRFYAGSLTDAKLNKVQTGGGGGGGGGMFFDPFMSFDPFGGGGGGGGDEKCETDFTGIAFKDELVYTVGPDFMNWPSQTLLCAWDTSGNLQTKYELNDGSNLYDRVNGLTFGASDWADILYLATGPEWSGQSGTWTLYSAWIGTQITRASPKGITYSSSSNAAGQALWVVVDGEPNDQLLKITWNISSQAATSTSLVSTGSWSTGMAALPTSNAEGVVYMDVGGSGYLYVIANESSSSRKLIKINAANGEKADDYNLSETADLNNDLGGITTDGTDLIVMTKDNSAIYKLNTDGTRAGGKDESWPCCWSFEGVQGFSYHSNTKEYYGFSGSQMVTFTSNLEVNEGSVKSLYATTSAAELLFSSSEVTGMASSPKTIGSAFTMLNQSGSLPASESAATIQGAHFYSNQLFLIAGGKIYIGFKAENVTTKPVGIAYTSADSGLSEAIYALVDASPKDKLIKFAIPSTSTTSEATLSAGTGTAFSDGVADAPSGNMDAMVFVGTGKANTSYLYAIGNEAGEGGGSQYTPTLYKINPSTGAELTATPLNHIHNPIGAMAFDGTNLILFGKQDNRVEAITITGTKVTEFGEKYVRASQSGANAMSYHSGRQTYYASQGLYMTPYQSDFETSKTTGSTMYLGFSGSGSPSSIKGAAWNQDLLYTGFIDGTDGWIGRGGLSVTASTQPAAIAYSPAEDTDGISNQLTGVQLGEALWVLVEGSPTQKIVKLSTSGTLCDQAGEDNSACTAKFPTDSSTALGYVDAPTANGVGLTYLNDTSGNPHLWLVANESGQQVLFKILPTTGSVVGSGISLSERAEIHVQLGGVTHDGTNLLVFGKSENFLATLSTDGELDSKTYYSGGVINGSASLAYRQDKTQIITAKDNKFSQWVSFGGQFTKATDYTGISPIDSTDDITGMTFKADTGSTFTDDILYIAYVEGSDGKVGIAGIPADKTNKPKGLAFAETDYTCDSTACAASNDYMYVVVEGIKSGDHVLKLDFSGGATTTIAADFVLPTENAESIAYIPGTGQEAGTLQVAYLQNNYGGGGQGGPTRQIASYTTDHTADGWGQLGSSLQMSQDDPCCGELMGLAYDGEFFVAAPRYGGPHLDIIDRSGNKDRTIWMQLPTGGSVPEAMTGVAYRGGDDPEYFTVQGKNVYRFDENGIGKLPTPKFTLSDSTISTIKGATFATVLAKEQLYLGVLVGNTGYIRSAVIPEATPTLTSDPKGMAYDGQGNFYAILDATPRDKIVRLAIDNDGDVTLDTSWGNGGAVNSPGAATEGITYVPSGNNTAAGLYVVTNDDKPAEICPEGGGQCSSRFEGYPALYRMTATTTGKFEKGWAMAFQWSRSNPIDGDGTNDELLQCDISSLAYDGDDDRFYMAMVNGQQCPNDWGSAAVFQFNVNDYFNGTQTNWGDHANIMTTRADNIQRFYENIGLSVEGQEALVVLPKTITLGQATSTGFASDRRLVVSAHTYSGGDEPDRIIRLSTNSPNQAGYDSSLPPRGVSNDKYTISPVSPATSTQVRGMAFLGQDLYIADAADDVLYKTFLPEQTVETTVVGDYVAQLTAMVRSNSYATTTSYSILRNSNPKLVVNSPQNGFVATSSPATLSGYINDPAAEIVTVGMELPYIVLAEDGAEDGATSTAKWTTSRNPSSSIARWHIDSTVISPKSGSNSWRFGIPGEENFRGHPSQGTRAHLTLGNPGDESTAPTGVISVTGPIELTFDSWFESRIDPGHDIKKLMLAIVEEDLAGNDVSPSSSDWQEIARWVGPGFEFTPPANAHDEWELFETTPEEWNSYIFDLEQFNPDPSAMVSDFKVMLRFTFDSVDQFGFGKGWAVDNVKVAGSGVLTAQVGTELLDPPQTINGIKYFKSFTGSLPITEGQNRIGAFFELPYMPVIETGEVVLGYLDQTPPVVAFDVVPSSTNETQIDISGTVDDMTFSMLTVYRVDEDGATSTIYTTTALSNVVGDKGTFTLPVTMPEGEITFLAEAMDQGYLTSSTSTQIIADRTAPTGTVDVVSVTSEGEVLVGDNYFVTVYASDSNSELTTSGVSTVVDKGSGRTLEATAAVPTILKEMHKLNLTSTGATTTHMTLNTVDTGTPIGVNTVSVTLTDAAGNSQEIEGTLNVVSQRTNRNYFLFPEFNYMGLALIPDDGDDDTDDDASIARLMEQEVTDRVNTNLVAEGHGTVRLKDIIESVSAFTNTLVDGTPTGVFTKYNPGPAADELSDLSPFQGMTIRTLTEVATSTTDGGSTTTVDVFKKVSVAGFTAKQSVPIRYNIQGFFFQLGQLPPDEELWVGYNLVAPHILKSTLFDTVYRGALIPKQLAVSALTFDRSVDASVDTNGDITASIAEGFSSSTLNDYLAPTLSYWTYIVDDPDDERTNSLGGPRGPTITP